MAEDRQKDRLRGQPLPHNIGAEQSVLGGAMMKLEPLAAMMASLSREDFYEPKHQLIFEAIASLNENQKPCDILTVTNQLISSGLISQAGGREYIQRLPSAVPFVENFAVYIDVVADLSVKRRMILALDGIIDLCFASDHEAEQLIELAAQRIMHIREEGESVGLTQLGDILGARINELGAIARGELPQPMRIDFPALNRVLGGMRKGALYILASRPGVGKSALSLNIAHNLSRLYQAVVAVFSLEMSKEEVATRLLSSKTGMSFQQLESINKTDKASWDKIADGLGELYGLPIYIDDRSSINVVEIHARCRQLQLQKQRLDLVIVDYLQLMGSATSRSKAENRQQQIAEISRMLKVMARDLEVPILALSQLSREVDRAGRRPRLADLRESGAIEQDADVVMFLHDPNRQEEEGAYQQDVCNIDLIVEKNRQGERTTVTLEWCPQTLTFTEPGYRGEPEPPF